MDWATFYMQNGVTHCLEKRDHFLCSHKTVMTKNNLKLSIMIRKTSWNFNISNENHVNVMWSDVKWWVQPTTRRGCRAGQAERQPAGEISSPLKNKQRVGESCSQRQKTCTHPLMRTGPAHCQSGSLFLQREKEKQRVRHRHINITVHLMNQINLK